MNTMVAKTTSAMAQMITRRRSSVRCSTRLMRPSSACAFMLQPPRRRSAEGSRPGEAVVGDVLGVVLRKRTRGQRRVIDVFHRRMLLGRGRGSLIGHPELVVQHV